MEVRGTDGWTSFPKTPVEEWKHIVHRGHGPGAMLWPLLASWSCHVIVTVTEALVLRPLLEDRGRITESIRILVPIDRIKQKCFPGWPLSRPHEIP